MPGSAKIACLYVYHEKTLSPGTNFLKRERKKSRFSFSSFYIDFIEIQCYDGEATNIKRKKHT